MYASFHRKNWFYHYNDFAHVSHKNIVRLEMEYLTRIWGNNKNISSSKIEANRTSIRGIEMASLRHGLLSFNETRILTMN